MSVGSINFSGIASGIDTNSIISELLTIDRQPETILNTQITNLQNKQTAYNTVSAALLSMQNAASALDGPESFGLVTAASSDSSVATVTAQPGAQVGSHSITVSKLAQTQTVSSALQTSETNALGFTGQIMVNGTAVNVQSSDTLQSLASSINSSHAGVTASIIAPSSGQYYLTIASNNSGLQGQFSLSDTAGNSFLSSTLGIFGGAPLGNAVSATVAGSNLFTDSSTAVGTLLGQATPASGTVQITSNASGSSVTQSVNIDLSQSLSQIASSINSAFGSTVAQVVSVTNPTTQTTEQQLQLSGVSSASNLVDSNNVLANLGLVQPTTLSNAVSSTIAGSGLFTDNVTSVGTLEGQATPASGTVQITSNASGSNVTKSVSIDLSQSLSQIASSINAAFGNGSTVAQVISVTNPITQATEQQLQLSGVSSASDLVDSNNVLANLGLVQDSYGSGRQLIAAQDASFTIDNLAATSPSNTVSNVLSGVTINLLKDGGASTNFTVSADTTTITTNINAFVTAFNSAADSINTNATYDSTTGTTGILFGDLTTSNIVNDLTSIAGGAVSGLSGTLNSLAAIGITLDTSDHLNVDASTLSSALSSNLSSVKSIFKATATASNPTVQFVSSTSSTQPSPSTGYAVQITQPATRAALVGSNGDVSGTLTHATALPATLGQNETLTFSGPLFGSTNVTAPLSGKTITLTQGSTPSEIVSQINADPDLNGALTASIDSATGALQLTARNYGSSGEFAVSSALPASTSNSTGIGTAVVDAKGIDVQGTINGEASTGSGQFLTDTQTGGLATGLQLLVPATTAGSYGTVDYTSGIADQLNNYVTQTTDTVNGSLTDAVSGIQTNITDLQNNIASIETQITATQTYLQQEFSNMETAVSQLKAAGSALTSLFGSSTTTSSTPTVGSASSSSSSSSSSS